MAHIRPETVTEIRIGSGECNSKWLTVLSLSQYKNLKSVVIGYGSYQYVNELKMIGLSELESVEIGMNSFKSSNGHFYLKNCPGLKSLKIGSLSFSDYSVCEIEDVDALESIGIGELDEWSRNFDYAPLELKSILIHNE